VASRLSQLARPARRSSQARQYPLDNREKKAQKGRMYELSRNSHATVTHPSRATPRDQGTHQGLATLLDWLVGRRRQVPTWTKCHRAADRRVICSGRAGPAACWSFTTGSNMRILRWRLPTDSPRSC